MVVGPFMTAGWRLIYLKSKRRDCMTYYHFSDSRLPALESCLLVVCSLLQCDFLSNVREKEEPLRAVVFGSCKLLLSTMGAALLGAG